MIRPSTRPRRLAAFALAVFVTVFVTAVFVTTVLAAQESPPTLSEAGREAFAKWDQDGDVEGAVALLEKARQEGRTTEVDLALLGTLLIESNRAADGLAVLRPVADAETADPAVLYNAGRAALLAGDLAAAERYLGRSVRLVPGSPAARELGLLRARQERIAEAYSLLRPWVEQNPADREAKVAAVIAGLRLGRAAEVGPWIDSLPVGDPRVDLLRGQYLTQLGRAGEAVLILEPLAKNPPPEWRVDVERFLADAYLESNRPADAVRLLTGQVGEDVRLGLLLAEAQHKTGDPAAAALTLQPFTRVMLEVEEPKGGPAFQLSLDYGRYLVASKRAAEAVPFLELATRMRPNDFLSWKVLGEALTTAGRADEGKAALAKAVELDEIAAERRRLDEAASEDPGIKTMLQVQEAIARGENQRALAMLRQEIALSPDDLRPRVLEVRLLLTLGRNTEALRAAEAAAAHFPEHPDMVYQRGLVHLAMQSPEAAEQDFRKALEIAPEHIPAMNDLAVVLIARGETEEAKNLLRRVLELRPEDERARANLERLGG